MRRWFGDRTRDLDVRAIVQERCDAAVEADSVGWEGVSQAFCESGISSLDSASSCAATLGGYCVDCRT